MRLRKLTALHTRYRCQRANVWVFIRIETHSTHERQVPGHRTNLDPTTLRLPKSRKQGPEIQGQKPRITEGETRELQEPEQPGQRQAPTRSPGPAGVYRNRLPCRNRWPRPPRCLGCQPASPRHSRTGAGGGLIQRLYHPLIRTNYKVHHWPRYRGAVFVFLHLPGFSTCRG